MIYVKLANKCLRGIYMKKDKILLRIDNDLKIELELLAKDRKRSLNNLIVSILSNYIKNIKKKDD